MRIVYSYIFLLLFGIMFSSCENKFVPPKTDLNSDDIPEQESWNSSVAFSDSGKVKAILRAGHIMAFNKKGYTTIDSGAKVDFYRDMVIVSTLTSRRGKILEPSKNIEIYDSVVVINNEGSILKTQKLFWDNQTQKVSTEEYVKIKTPKEEVEGIGFISDQNLKNYTIFKVTGTFSE
ncbi:MAG: LPS export ABC transporter periplasmic protein LptC [Candidatus Kapaibacterium sp.]